MPCGWLCAPQKCVVDFVRRKHDWLRREDQRRLSPAGLNMTLNVFLLERLRCFNCCPAPGEGQVSVGHVRAADTTADGADWQQPTVVLAGGLLFKRARGSK